MVIRFLLVLLLLINCSCNHWDKISRQTLKETRKLNDVPILHCVRLKDSIISIYFHKNGHFFQLEGPRKKRQKNQRYYSGFYKVKNDTIFMDYFKGIKPDNMNSYLLKGNSEKFLIYSFKNKKDTVILTITQGSL